MLVIPGYAVTAIMRLITRYGILNDVCQEEEFYVQRRPLYTND